MAEWTAKQAENGFTFSGTAVDLFWQRNAKYLEEKVAEYFEWIEKESAGISPSQLRQESIEQCVGAVVTFGRVVRDATIKKNQILQKLDTEVDHGHWSELNDHSISERGTKLLLAIGLGPSATASAKLNHFVNDQKWLPLLLSIISLVISLAAFMRK